MAAIDDHPLLVAVRDAWNQLVGPSQRAVVAVSGGPDSVALAMALREQGIEPFIIGHVNHQLRLTESHDDERFVEEFASQIDVPVEIRRVETRLAAARENLEATARRLRYEQLADIARHHGASVLVTGHTADDQAETVLFRLMRGCGLRGLAGIPEQRRWNGLTIVRPLLKVRRRTVLDFLQVRQQDCRHDSSNQDLRFARNRIRHELMPQLEEQFSAGIVTHLIHVAEQAAAQEAVTRRFVLRSIRKIELARSAALVILNVEETKAFSPFLLCEIGRHIWRREHWPLGEMSSAHWRRLASVMRGELTAADFPNGISARRLPRVVRIGPGA